MKILVCQKCSDMRALNPLPKTAVVCACGSSAAWWDDPFKGTARFAGRGPSGTAEWAAPHVWFLGLNNRYLVAAMTEPGRILDDEGYRDLHEWATDAPGYQFDASKKACWAILVRPGMSSDTLVVPRAPAGLANRPDWLPEDTTPT